MASDNVPGTQTPRKPGPPRARRDEVLAAASRVFYRRGYRTATMHDIAEEMNLTSGALYHYIRTKDDLLEEIVIETMRRLIAMGDSVTVLDISPVEKIRRLLREHLALMMRHRELFFITYRERIELAEAPRAKLGELEDQYYHIIRRIIADAVDQRELAVESPTVSALALIGMMDWTLLWYRPGAGLETDDIADMYFNLFVFGSATEHGREVADS